MPLFPFDFLDAHLADANEMLWLATTLFVNYQPLVVFGMYVVEYVTVFSELQQHGTIENDAGWIDTAGHT